MANGPEVEMICRGYGFEVVDVEELSLDAQITLLGAARYVVDIHGAGLVNLMFRQNAPLSLLELFPHDNLPPHYFWLCLNFGFGYHALHGSMSTVSRGFVVDPSQLQHKIEAMLTSLGHAMRKRHAASAMENELQGPM